MSNMPSTNENEKNTAQNAEKSSAKLHRKIKDNWSKLTDEDVKLYATKPDQFYVQVKAKQNISIDDAKKKVAQLEKECSGDSAKAA